MSTATVLGLLGLHRLLLLRRLLRLGSNLGLNSLGIRLTFLSNGATEALLLGTALSIALAAPAKTAAAGLGRKGSTDALVKQLVGIDMLARSCFHRSGRLDNVLDGLFGSLGKLLNDIAALGANILSVEHDRLTAGLNPNEIDVHVSCEVGDKAHGDRVRGQLIQSGYHVKID